METKTAVVLLTASGVTITVLAAKLAKRNRQLKTVMSSAMKLQTWSELARRVVTTLAEQSDDLWIPEQLAFDVEAYLLMSNNEM